ncbi:hypothetical protein AAFF_G00039990 [Aldrovandia affinis]|uniref:Uncharacterized protein n=1 Tax=Aldrovandia affinis TaxID=143900 RepID=A0AAD7S329_9TELE|nr:hypothetical protein AAFF_G00039990 [Aldrovandia affinis]
MATAPANQRFALVTPSTCRTSRRRLFRLEMDRIDISTPTPVAVNYLPDGLGSAVSCRQAWVRAGERNAAESRLSPLKPETTQTEIRQKGKQDLQ